MGYWGSINQFYVRGPYDKFGTAGWWLTSGANKQRIGTTISWKGICYNIMLYNNPDAANCQTFEPMIYFNNDTDRIGLAWNFLNMDAKMGYDVHTKPFSLNYDIDLRMVYNIEFPSGVKITNVDVYVLDTTAACPNDVYWKLECYGEEFGG